MRDHIGIMRKKEHGKSYLGFRFRVLGVFINQGSVIGGYLSQGSSCFGVCIMVLYLAELRVDHK